jgi:hypothetical protein
MRRKSLAGRSNGDSLYLRAERSSFVRQGEEAVREEKEEEEEWKKRRICDLGCHNIPSSSADYEIMFE